MKVLLTAILTAALMGAPLTAAAPARSPLQIADIGGVAAAGSIQKSRLQSGGKYVQPIPEPIPEPEPVYETNNDGWQYYGVCTITHYCACEKCCGQWASGYTASGTLATANRTVAADLPFGTRLLINGQEYIVEDRGVSGAWVDIFVNSHEEAYARGMFDADVYIWQ